MGESGSKFKIVDKRSFTEDGELRDGVTIEDESLSQSVHATNEGDEGATTVDLSASKGDHERPEADLNTESSERAFQNSTPKAAGGSSSSEVEGQFDDESFPFAAFVQSLAQQAMMQLGMMPGPGGQQGLSLEGARSTIDILDMLKGRTEGNRTAEESTMMGELVHQLRMAYLEVTKAITQQAENPGAVPGAGPSGRAPF